MHNNYQIKKFYFISTDLEMNFNYNEKKIIAGDWCFKNYKNYKKDKNNKNLKILEKEWENEKILSKDYKYLEKIIDLYSNKLSVYLNSFNNKNFSHRFWKIILMSWLNIYISSQYYRWKIVNSIVKKKNSFNFYLITNLDTSFKILDTVDYYNFISSNSEFNYKNFRRLIVYFKKKGAKINLVKKKLPKKLFINKKFDYPNRRFLSFSLNNSFNFIIRFFNFISLFFLRKNNIFIEKETFRKVDNIKINFLLKQLPTALYDGFDDKFKLRSIYNYLNQNKKKRSFCNLSNNKKIKYQDQFTKYIDTYIIDDIPICFLEGFNNLMLKAKKINFKPKIILSSFYHYFHELFKFWVAFSVENKTSKFFIVSHGSGYVQKFSTCIKFENKICDKKINWCLPKCKNEIQLPATKFISFKNKKCQKKYLSFVDFKPQIYLSRIGELSRPFKDDNFTELFININKKIKENFFYFPYIPQNTSYNNIPTNLDKYLKTNQIGKKNSFLKNINKSKLIICTYPQTAFSESIISGPTILLYNQKKEWFIDNKFKKIHAKLVKYKIVFNDPKKAALHINKNWDNIDRWWNSKNVKSAINEFIKQTCLISNNSINTWVKFLNNEIKK